METNYENFTPDQSIELITKTLANFRRNYRTKSIFFLLWGWVIAGACLTQFALIKLLIALKYYKHIGLFSALNWITFAVAGFIIQFMIIKRLNKEKQSISSLDRFYSILWIVSTITFVSIGALCFRYKIYPAPFVFCIAGMATLISGWVLKFLPLILGGILFFIFAGITSFVLSEYQLLISTASIVLGYIIPGYLLRNTKE
jgi:hypothetical protein